MFVIFHSDLVYPEAGFYADISYGSGSTNGARKKRSALTKMIESTSMPNERKDRLFVNPEEQFRSSLQASKGKTYRVDVVEKNKKDAQVDQVKKSTLLFQTRNNPRMEASKHENLKVDRAFEEINFEAIKHQIASFEPGKRSQGVIRDTNIKVDVKKASKEKLDDETTKKKKQDLLKGIQAIDKEIQNHHANKHSNPAIASEKVKPKALEKQKEVTLEEMIHKMLSNLPEKKMNSRLQQMLSSNKKPQTVLKDGSLVVEEIDSDHMIKIASASKSKNPREKLMKQIGKSFDPSEAFIKFDEDGLILKSNDQAENSRDNLMPKRIDEVAKMFDLQPYFERQPKPSSEEITQNSWTEKMIEPKRVDENLMFQFGLSQSRDIRPHVLKMDDDSDEPPTPGSYLGPKLLAEINDNLERKFGFGMMEDDGNEKSRRHFDVNAKKLENIIPNFKNGRVDNFEVPFSNLDPKLFEPVEDNLERKFGFSENDAKSTQLKELAKKRSELLKKLNELGNHGKPQNSKSTKSSRNALKEKQVLNPKKTRQQQTMVKKKYALLRASKPELTLMVNPNPIDYKDSLNEAGIRAYIHKVNETANYEDGVNIGSHMEALITLENEGKKICKHSKKSKDESHSNTSGNYSRNACILECRAKMFKHKCKCLPYFLLNMTMIQAKSCNHNGLKCIAQVYGEHELVLEF